MIRREFLKLTGLLSAALFVPIHPLGKVASLPIEVQSQGKLYRGTADGKIYVSEDAGRNWRLHTSFGSEISILGLKSNIGGQLQAQLGFAGHSFILTLAQEGDIWKTT